MNQRARVRPAMTKQIEVPRTVLTTAWPAPGGPGGLNPCLSCGACCAFYRVSFYWAEGDDAPGGWVPAGLTEKVDDFRRAMKGTLRGRIRCTALEGEIGRSVRCGVYKSRPSTCREFAVSWERGGYHGLCDRARMAHGLAPLSPPESDGPPILPRAA